MRLLLLFFLLLNCFGIALFAQSKKKINEQLTKQLSLEKSHYDSLTTAYKNNLSALITARSLAGNTLYKGLGSINYSIEEKRYELRKQLGILETLNWKESPVVDIYNDKISSYYALKTSLEPLFNFNFPERKTVAPLNLGDTRKISDRNSKLNAQIALYKEQSTALKTDLASILDYKTKLNAFNSSSDDLVLEYSDELNRLTEANSVVKRTLITAKQEFRDKGPKGYRDAYFLAFPDVFPGKSSAIPTTHDEPEEIRDVINTAPPRNIDGGTSIDVLSADYKPVSSGSDLIYDVVDTTAEFPGGRDSLVSFLSSNIHYPDFAFTNKIGGKCYIKFVISETGKVSNAKVVRGIPNCKECDDEAVRVVNSMPDWRPGILNGKAVSQWFNLPIVFKVPDDKK